MKMIATIVATIAAVVLLTGCGLAESISTGFTGKQIEQVETKDLICVTVLFGDSVSVDCVRK